jgi:ribosomal protein S18 acetylase RimI-like enzyme
MDKPIAMFRRMESGEEEQVCQLVRKVFNEFVAPLYAQEGVDEFLRYIDPVLMAARAQSNHFVLLAEERGKLIGVIEVRDFNHIPLLFVSSDAQRRGIAKRLMEKTLNIVHCGASSITEITVHSSPNAIGAYERLGFKSQGPEVLEHGIRYIPMKLSLGNGDDG